MHNAFRRLRCGIIENPEEPFGYEREPGIVVAEVSFDFGATVGRSNGERVDLDVLQLEGEFVREQNIGQLALFECFRRVERSIPIDIIEIDLSIFVVRAGDVQNAGRCVVLL